MEREEGIRQVMSKNMFSHLPYEDVLRAWNHFSSREVSDSERIRLTRALLHRVYGAFSSDKLLSGKEKSPEWILRKHLSTRERLPYYSALYRRLLADFHGSVFDLGAGANGFSVVFFPRALSYVGIEGIGQLVRLTQTYFEREHLSAEILHASLFNLPFLKKTLRRAGGQSILFLFKVLDSLEMLEPNYSKRLLLELSPLVQHVVVSFATKSMISRRTFRVKRTWLLDFIKEHFVLLDDFELGGERYLVFSKR